MTYSKVDKKFIDGFKKHYIGHLKKPIAQNEDNAAQKMMLDADPGNFGKITRIFDGLAYVNCVSKDEFDRRLKEAGSFESYIKPIIDAVADELLTADKLHLNDEVIQAIGIDRYAELIRGKVIKTPDGKQKVVAQNQTNPQDEATDEEKRAFTENETSFAHNVLASILTCYSASLYEHNLPKEERARAKLDVTNNKIRDAIIEAQSIRDDAFKISRLDPNPFNDMSPQDYLAKAKELSKKIQLALSQKDPSADELSNLYQQAKALSEKGLELFGEKKSALVRVMNQYGKIALDVCEKRNSIIELKPGESEKPTFEDIEKKIITLYEMLTPALQKLTPGSDAHTAINELQHHLNTGRKEVYDEYGLIDAPVFKTQDKVVLALSQTYDDAVSIFLENIDKAIINNSIKPFEMNILQRIAYKITGGLLCSEAKALETAGKSIKEQLLTLKSKAETEAEAEKEAIVDMYNSDEEPEAPHVN